MFNCRVFLALAALLVVSLTVGSTAAADSPSSCVACIGPSLEKLADKYVEKRNCWFNTHHHVVLKLKIWNLIALNQNFQAVHDQNNQVVEAKCKTEVSLKECDMKDFDQASECQTANLKANVASYREQEMCHGRLLPSETLRIAIKLLFGSFAGWDKIHPDC